MRQILKGSTDQSVVIRIVDATDGTPETAVTSGTAGLDLKYRREGAATVDLTESDLAALTTAHTDGGMLHIGAGYYRVDVPDAAFATGAAGVLVFGSVTGMVVIAAYVELVDFCLAGQSATDLKDFADTGYDPVAHSIYVVQIASMVTDIDATGLGNIQSVVANQLQNYRLDELLAADSDIDGAQPPTVGSVFHELMSKTAGSFTFGQADDSLEAIRDAGGGAVSIAAGGITSASFAANSITAAATAADFATEVQASCNAALVANGLDDIADTTDLPDVIFDATLGSRAAGTFGKVVADTLALLDDPRTEPGQGALPVNPDAVTKIDYMYKFMRNKKTQTATLLSIFADNETTVDHKSIVSSVGGTTTLGEIITGA